MDEIFIEIFNLKIREEIIISTSSVKLRSKQSSSALDIRVTRTAVLYKQNG